MLIKELRLVQEHMERLDTEIADIVGNCREGQILLSMSPIGVVQAATIIATIGNIANFEKASELKCYFGWAPRRDQTGVSFDRTKLTKRGMRPTWATAWEAAFRPITSSFVVVVISLTTTNVTSAGGSSFTIRYTCI
ncbi:transposase [Ktedonobacter sp. SOSP1-52]|uniref:transposase n=1 Tax=Ktedonobacter sp. SOSP1-52 TaxID=2778366 RepID=UPI001916972A|nr:transposase [Ktedonobacter sp. SOSP1-52]